MAIVHPTARAHTHVIDLHGLRDALRSRNNKIRSDIIRGIESKNILILKYVAEELKGAYEQEYRQLQSFQAKKYLTIELSDEKKAALMIELNGSSIFGSVPSLIYFQSLAAALNNKLILITSDSAITRYQHICSKCGLSANSVISFEEYV